jgi:hypothetical protein
VEVRSGSLSQMIWIQIIILTYIFTKSEEFRYTLQTSELNVPSQYIYTGQHLLKPCQRFRATIALKIRIELL